MRTTRPMIAVKIKMSLLDFKRSFSYNCFIPTESVYVTKINGQHSKRASDEIVDITDDDDGGNEEEDDEEDRYAIDLLMDLRLN